MGQLNKRSRNIAKLKFWQAVGGAAAGEAAGQIIGMGAGAVTSDRNMNDWRDQTSQNMQNAYYMSNVNWAQQKQMWDATNYEAQMKHILNAGLNPAMLYGKGGAGGATTGNVNASPAGANVGDSKANVGMGMMMGLSAQKQEAEIKVLEAQANALNTEATKKAGVDTANVEANTNLTRIQTGIAEIQKEVNENTKVDLTMKIQAEAGKVRGEMNSAIANGTIAEATVKTAIQQANADLIGTYLKNQLTRENIQYTERQTKAIADQVATAYINAFSNQRNANSNETNSGSQLKKQIQDALYQNGVLELGDRKLNQDLIMGVMQILKGGPMNTSTQRYDGNGNFLGETQTQRH